MSLLSRVLNHHSEKSPRPGLTPVSLNSSLHKRTSKSVPRFALHIDLESPPVVLYGQPHESTGSIISGVLKLEILSGTPKETIEPVSSRSLEAALSPVSSAVSLVSPEVEMDLVVLLLVQTMHYSKPFVVSLSNIGSCDKCLTRENTLARWDALLGSVPFQVGSHAYPFSHLIPGLLAATTKLGGNHSHSYVKYELVAVASGGGKEVSLVVPVNILRSILRGPDRNSQRVFPPTEVTASAVLPNVIYPKSTFPIELRMDNVVNSKGDRRWRMRKLLWKLEEHTQVRAHACAHHDPKLKAIEESHRKQQLYKSLKLGLPASNGHEGPSRNLGLHHSTVQTLMFYGPPPVSTAGTRAEQIVAAATLPSAGPAITGNQDIIEEEEDVPTNRPVDEAVHFDEDFGGDNSIHSGDNRGTATSNEHGGAGATGATGTTGAAGAGAGAGAVGGRSNRPSDALRRRASSNAASSRGASPLQTANTPQNELFLDELRVVAHGDVKSGWKSDFTGKGQIELVADIIALECSTGLRQHVTSKSSTDSRHDETQGMLNEATVSCDIEDPELGIYVSHILVVEVIVAEEVVQQQKTGPRGEGLTPVTSVGSVSSTVGSVGVPTGAARVLRMQFKVNVTERSGLGIAWDDEVPPTYDDVRALSPPTYENSGTGTPVASALNLASPSRPTPAVLYGLGDTPFVGSFRHNQSIDQSMELVADAEDGIQELTI